MIIQRGNPDASPLRVVCVIPAHNEEAQIASVVTRARRALGGAGIVVVVNDGSSDETRQRALLAGAVVVSNVVSLGYGAAIQTGARMAARLDADIVATLDGDGQHEPEDIGILVGPLKSGEADVVVGCRYVNGRATYAVPWARRLGHRLFSRLIRLFTGLRIRDSTSGFQALSRPALAFVLSDAWPPDYPDADVLITYAYLGLRVVEREVRFRAPPDAKKSMHAGLLRVLWYFYAMGLSFLRLAVTAIALRRGLFRRSTAP